MKLYSVNGSPNCRKVHAVIEYLGLDVDTEYLDFVAGDLRKPEFLSINPNGMVPVLVDGDIKLWESNAIMQYLADKKPGNTIFPSDSASRANITRWQTWEQAHFNKAAGGILFEVFLKPNMLQQPCDDNKLKEYTESFHRFAAVLNGQLANRQYVTGDFLTLADFSIACVISYSDLVPIPVTDYANIVSWYERLSDIPAWKKSVPSFQEEMRKKTTAQ